MNDLTKRRVICGLLCLLLAMLCAGCAATSNPREGILSSFSTTDLEGNTVDASVLADAKLTMVNVWATYCGPCLSEMPELGTLAAELADDGVQIVGLVTNVLQQNGEPDAGMLALAQDIVAKTGADYLHLVPSVDLYALLNQITAVPTTFFVDADGVQVGDVYLGAREREDWEQIITETLALLPVKE